jgi:hypothetical protein
MLSTILQLLHSMLVTTLHDTLDTIRTILAYGRLTPEAFIVCFSLGMMITVVYTFNEEFIWGAAKFALKFLFWPLETLTDFIVKDPLTEVASNWISKHRHLLTCKVKV